ncbi:LacI family DNA-binding transcriptional regulator [Amycolatopsis sp. cg5]|uniref:LacI family DNA-binding transcriptional regulator n=1 Tax=Amycolatopsis sp. cg5 TaxID=3238802 RepID=UPI0035260255
MTALSPELPLWDTHVTLRFGVAMAVHADPYSGELLQAIKSAAAEAGCTIQVADTGDSVSEEAAVIRALRADQVDGVLLIPAIGDDAVINGLVRMGVPTVLVDRLATRTDVDQVGTENIQSMSTLVKHLVNQRHRRIGLISGNPGSSVTLERETGFRNGLGRAGLRWSKDVVVCGESTPGGAAKAMKKLLDGWPAPTALVVANEAMLIGVQYEAHRRGIKIGTDLAVVGYGDGLWTRNVCSPLTTMSQPIAEIGRKAMHMLLSRIAEPERSHETVRLAPSFHHRSSCGC